MNMDDQFKEKKRPMGECPIKLYIYGWCRILST